jgi:hypothetical protein
LAVAVVVAVVAAAVAVVCLLPVAALGWLANEGSYGQPSGVNPAKTSSRTLSKMPIPETAIPYLCSFQEPKRLIARETSILVAGKLQVADEKGLSDIPV